MGSQRTSKRAARRTVEMKKCTVESADRPAGQTLARPWDHRRFLARVPLLLTQSVGGGRINIGKSPAGVRIEVERINRL